MIIISYKDVENYIQENAEHFADDIDVDLEFEYDVPERRTYTGSDGFPVEYEETSFTAKAAEITSISVNYINWYNAHFKQDEIVIRGEAKCSYDAEAQIYEGDGEEFWFENTGFTKSGEEDVPFDVLVKKIDNNIVWELE